MRHAAAALFAAGAAGHGWINEPPSRTGATMESAGSCPYGSCLWFSQSCAIGCPKCLGVDSTSGKCDSPAATETLPMAARTYNLGTKSCGTNPWCAPGSSPIMNPCGIAGGDVVQGRPGNGGDAPPGYKQGTHGDAMPELAGVKRTWKVGDAVDVAWSVVANHGGGYQYRLCPKGTALTEACFQQTPLAFVGDQHQLQYTSAGNFPPLNPALPPDATPASDPPQKAFPVPVDPANRTSIPAVDVSTGTIPAGSTWRRNPIPACKNILGGSFNVGCHRDTGNNPDSYQFPPAGPDLGRPGFLLGGFGAGSCGGCSQPGGNNPADCGKLGKFGRRNCTQDATVDEVADHFFAFSIVDKVRVPKVPPGEYVVSFRWDCEQTPQVWAQCSDVTISA